MTSEIRRMLREPSTWAGLAAVGVILGGSPADMSAWSQVAALVAGCVAIVLPEGGSRG